MEKKYRIEGNDIVINHELCSEKELNHVIELASSLGFVTKFNHTPSYVTGFVFEVTNWRLPNLAKNKVIIDKLDEIFGYNKEQASEDDFVVYSSFIVNAVSHIPTKTDLLMWLSDKLGVKFEVTEPPYLQSSEGIVEKCFVFFGVKTKPELSKLFTDFLNNEPNNEYKNLSMTLRSATYPLGEWKNWEDLPDETIYRILGYNKDVVEGKWDKFREYWEELGKPELEVFHKDDDFWSPCPCPSFLDKNTYRLKDDPNWEVRLAWVNSGRTLEIEASSVNNWREAAGVNGTYPNWCFDSRYRIKPTQSPTTRVVDTSQDGDKGLCCEVPMLSMGDNPCMDERITGLLQARQEEVKARQQQLIDELNGITKAKRYNKGKPQLSYLLDTPLANNELAKVFEEGAKKYERDNWKLGLENDKLMDSALRHLQAYAGGEEVDAETGCHHLAHADWNVKVLLEQVLASKAEPQRRKLCSDLDTSESEKYVMKRTPNMEFVVSPPEDVVGDYDADVHEDGSAEHLVFKRRFDKKSLFKFGKMSLAGEEKPIPITRKELAQELDKDLAYVEKLNDGQEVIFNGATYVVRGD